jgi:hypothetical protein
MSYVVGETMIYVSATLGYHSISVRDVKADLRIYMGHMLMGQMTFRVGRIKGDECRLSSF